MEEIEKQLNQMIEEGISSKLFPACSIGYVKNGVSNVVFGGTYTFEDSRKIDADSIFDIASLTKPIPTSCLALKLIDEGKLGLNDKVFKFIPELSGPYRSEITVWNLLTHTLDFDFRLAAYKDKPAKEILQAVFDATMKPIGHSQYSNAASILLGLLVERIYGKTLADLGVEIFFGPLGMLRTTFEPLKIAKKTEIVPSEIDQWRGLVHGQVHDESTAGLWPMVVGAAGLFSTVPDLLKFLQMLLNRGEFGGQKFFSKPMVEKMPDNQIKAPGQYAALGWELNQPRFMGRFSEHTFGKTGRTGCLFLCNLDLSSGVVILTNHIFPKRPEDFGPINQFRASIADVVFGA